MSNFSFLDNDFPAIADSAKRAEMYAPYDPRSACFYGRRTLELVVNWLYDHDSAFRRPYDPQATLATLMHERSFEQNIPLGVRQKAHTVRKLGNLAVHDTRPVRQLESATVLKEVFQVLYWLARTYQQDNRAVLPVHFDPRLIPASPEEQQEASKASLQKLEADLAARDKQAQELLAREAALKAELDAMRAQVTASKQRNARVPDEHDYSRTEQETREVIIDLLLREVGWDPAGENVAEYPVTGLAGSPSGKGRVDYVLWGDDGNPLAVVEAKRTSKDSKAGKQQAVNYADCLEASYGQRPLIFYTNGYDIWLWDDARYPERKLQGFLTKDEMQRAVQRRRSAQDLAQVSIDQDIVNRYYQTEAVRRVNARFSQQFRKALLVMATGTGKTRTAIALVDVLMRAGWVKRVLFLADRKALVDQAVGAFKRHLPASSPVNLLSDKEAAESRLVVSTYHTMMGLIDARYENDTRLFGVGHFDLIIVDEAHRSIYRSFGAIFDYFDSLLVGLTATPKDEVDRNTY
ncbi:MAG: DEAD/DEAH box helicase family protein, partial [Deinococcota bacterium]